MNDLYIVIIHMTCGECLQREGENFQKFGKTGFRCQ